MTPPLPHILRRFPRRPRVNVSRFAALAFLLFALLGASCRDSSAEKPPGTKAKSQPSMAEPAPPEPTGRVGSAPEQVDRPTVGSANAGLSPRLVADPGAMVIDEDTTGVLFVVWGRVTAGDDRPLSQALVMVSKFRKASIAPEREVRVSAQTDSNGLYHLVAAGVDQGGLAVWATSPGRAAVVSRALAVANAKTTRRSRAGGLICEFQRDLRMPRAVEVRGRAEDESGAAIAGAEVYFFTPLLAGIDGLRSVPSEPVLTGTDGLFRATGVAEGENLAHAEATGFRALTKTVVLPTTSTLVLRLRRGGASVAGHVTERETGTPVAGAIVRALGERGGFENWMLAPRTVTDESGAYLLSGLEPGVVYLSASAPDFYSLGTGKAPFVANVVLRANDAVADMDLLLDRGRTLRGRFLEEATQKPVEGVAVVTSRDVATMGGGPEVLPAAVSGPDGTFELPRAGVMVSYNAVAMPLLVQKEGWLLAGTKRPGDTATEDRARLRVSVDESTVERTFLLTRELTLRGVVVTRTGTPVPGATVTQVVGGEGGDRAAARSAVRGRTELQTDANGAFAFPVLPGSRIGLVARKTGLGGGKSAIVSIGNEPPAPLTIRLAQSAVEGRVTAEGGVAVAGAKVSATAEIRGANEDTLRQVIGPVESGPDGRFALEDVPAGSIYLFATHPTMLLLDGLNLALAEGERKTGTELQMIRPRVLAGRVLDADGIPIPGAEIEAKTIGSLDFVETATSDESGTYRFARLRTDKVKLRVEAQTFAIRELDDVASDNPKYDIVLQKMNEVTLLGHVVDDATGAPIPGELSVQVFPRKDARLTRTRGGEFEVKLRPEGRVVLRIQSEGYSELVAGPEQVPNGTEGNDAMERTYRLTRGVRVTGRVLQRGAAGGAPQPVAGAEVAWVGSGTLMESVQYMLGTIPATTSAEGLFEFKNLAAGESTLRFRIEGAQKIHKRAFIIPKQEQFDLGDIVLENGAVVRGTVTRSGQPVEGIRVSLRGVRSADAIAATTNSEGKFEFGGLNADYYVLRCEQAGERPVTVADSSVVEVNLELGTGRLSGVVTRAGRGANATVTATSADRQVLRTTTELPVGSYVLEGLSAGNWEIVVAPRVDGPARPSKEVRESIPVKADQSLVRNYTLAAGRITGTIVDRNSQPVEGARVALLGAQDATTQWWGDAVVTDPLGRFGFDELAAGRYGLTASKGGIGSAMAAGVLVPQDGDAVPVTLALRENGGGTVVSIAKSMDNGTPLREAWCNFWGEAGGFDHGQQRDTNGRVVISNLPAGSYTMQVSAVGYSVVERQIVVEEGQTLTFEDELYEAGPLRLTLMLATGVGAAGARATVTPADPNSPELVREGTTDKNGYYAFRGLFPGEYTIAAVSADGSVRWSGTATIRGRAITNKQLWPAGSGAN